MLGKEMGQDKTEHKATLTIDANARSTAYSPMIFGGFLEHFGRQIYGGVFEPGSPLSDEKGFRHDVIAALRELKVPIVRWPGVVPPGVVSDQATIMLDFSRSIVRAAGARIPADRPLDVAPFTFTKRLL